MGRSRSASSAILEGRAKLQRLDKKASLASFTSSTPRACVKDWYPCTPYTRRYQKLGGGGGGGVATLHHTHGVLKGLQRNTLWLPAFYTGVSDISPTPRVLPSETMYVLQAFRRRCCSLSSTISLTKACRVWGGNGMLGWLDAQQGRRLVGHKVLHWVSQPIGHTVGHPVT